MEARAQARNSQVFKQRHGAHKIHIDFFLFLISLAKYIHIEKAWSAQRLTDFVNLSIK